MVLLFLLSVLLSVAALTFLQRPVYTARGTIWVDREPNLLPAPDLLQVETRDPAYFQSYYKSQSTILQSRALADATIEKAKLHENPHFNKMRRSGRGGEAPAGSVAREKLIDKFLEHVAVKPVRETRLVAVEFSDSSPRFAADTLNALFAAFVDMNVRRRYSVSQQATEFLSAQIAAVRSDIEGLERKIQEYGAEKNIVSLSATETTIVNSLAEINSALSAATIARIEKLARYNQIKNAPLGSIPASVNSPSVQRLSEDYSRLAQDYAKRLEVFRPEFPEMVQLQTQLDTARAALEQETRNLVSAVYADYEAALRNEESLQELFEKKKAEALNLNSNSIFYNSLRIEIQNKSALLDALLKRQGETEFSSQLKDAGTSSVWVVDAASIPTSPTSPNKKFNMLLALVFGLLGGMGFALLYEYLSSVVRNPRDIQRTTGLTTLGFIPLLAPQTPDLPPQRSFPGLKLLGRVPWPWSKRPQGAKDSGKSGASFELIAATEPDSVQAENYRSIRTTLFVSSVPGKFKSFLISSPLAREGKSSTASNLGITLALAGKKVILVDADLRKPRLEDIFSVPNNPGLTNYLSAQSDLPSVIKPTPHSGLSVVPSGPIPSHPVEILGSDRMDEASAYLRKHYDYVLFDVPPLLLVSDAIAIAPFIDAVILVAREGITPLSALRQAKQKLDAHRVKCFGVILNAVGDYGQESYYARQYRKYHR